MPFATYSELQAEVLNWLGRTSDTELTARLPAAIALAEAAFRRDLDAGVGDVIAGNATVTDEYTALPTDLIKLRQARVVGQGPLRIVPDAVLNAIDDDQPGTPTRASQVGTYLRVNPAPASTTDVEIVYTTLPSLTDTLPTNWLLTSHPDVYLYGTLVHAAVWAHDDRAGEFMARVGALVANINAAGKVSRGARDLSPVFLGNGLG